MKKALSLWLALSLLAIALPLSALAEDGWDDWDDWDLWENVEASSAEAAEEEEEEEIEFPDELLVGHPTVMKGDFFTEMFGNDTADIDVRALIHGYNLVNWDQEQGTYVIDTSVVARVIVNEDAAGNRTYFMALHDDLYYSDGTPITAWDYAFSLLLMMSPEIEQIGGKIYRAEHILGYDEYITGKTFALGGVEVLDTYQLAITLDHEFLPYFFEIGLLLCCPYPIHVIAPGCKVYDDGYGVYIGNEDPEIKEPIFTAELLRKTILDPETGYNTHPSVVCGPYVMTAYDGVTAHFEKNPYFKGTMEGVIPTIERISFTVADNDTLIQQLADGELHLVNKVVYGPTITDGMQNGPSQGIRFSPYPRIGLAFLTFTFDWPTVHEMEVRQAIAWCMDRDALTKAYCQDFGLRVDGYYGIEQWEYLLINGQLDYPIDNDPENPLPDEEVEKLLEKWEALNLDNLTQYTVDTDRANQLLDEAGWTLNRAGETYRPGVDDVRCKVIDGELIALDLSMMYPAGNHIAEYMQEYMIDNLNACGILLTLVPTEMEELLLTYYREKPRTTDMIYLATNYHVVVDPAITYSCDPTPDHLIWNNTYSDDEELYQRAVDMRKTPPGALYDYVVKWISFQERYNEVLPCIPIYSNIYFDFYTEQLQNYYITAHVTWSQAILEAYFGLAEEEENDWDDWDEEAELEDGEEFFED
ncbi:MAG: hypothetical protein IJQ33_09265 [Clostridia bacterium]|nr:hypothetical protein [Clostridia bacterium]